MNAKVIDGKAISSKIKELLSQEIEYLQSHHIPLIDRQPKLGYVLVGNKSASHLYDKMKKKACSEIGILATGMHFPESASQHEIKEYIIELNNDPTVDGVLIQLPLSDEHDETALFDVISREKDVDGIHPLNMAAMTRRENPFFTPCTPKGIMCLIKSVCPNIRGKKATVIGCSNIVGMPIAMLLQKEFATVTLCHPYTENLKEEVSTADILVSATGCPHLVRGDFIKKGAIVIDVGTQFIQDKSSKTGRRLVGDIEYNSVSKRAGYITPVPGGVGPMTIAMLMSNVVLAWKRNNFGHIRGTVDKLEEAKQLALISSTFSSSQVYL